MTNQSCAQAGDIQRSGIVPGAIPETSRIGAAEPGSPVVDPAAMLRGTERVCGTPTAWADMRNLARLLPLQAHPSKKALVTKHTLQFASYL